MEFEWMALDVQLLPKEVVSEGCYLQLLPEEVISKGCYLQLLPKEVVSRLLYQRYNNILFHRQMSDQTAIETNTTPRTAIAIGTFPGACCYRCRRSLEHTTDDMYCNPEDLAPEDPNIV
jgi:hypothetical protein